MLGAKVHKEAAEKVRRYLARRKLMANNYRIIRSGKFIYFPLARGASSGAALPGWAGELVDMGFGRADTREDYRTMLSGELGSGYGGASRGYDMIGDIAVIEADDRRTAAKVAKVLMKANPRIRTVLAKGGPVSGRYRTRSYRYVAGDRKYRTVYRENGASFAFDVRKAFFSPRLAHERERVCSAAKDGENVMVMFAGVGPFAIEIAKRHRKSRIVAIELNREAYRYMLENIRLNKVSNVEARLGDVRKVASDYAGFADRIVMPLPKDAYEFMDSVLKAAKKRCVVHYYAFGSKDSAYEDNIGKLRDFFKGKARFRVLSKRQVRPYSPRDIEIVVDFSLRR